MSDPNMQWLVVCGLFFGIGFLYGAFWRAHHGGGA